MATETRRPNSDGNTTWSVTGAASRYEAVQSNDGDTSYISANPVSLTQRFGLPATAIPSGSTINSVTIYAYVRGVASAIQLKLGFRISSTDYLSDRIGADTSYELISNEWTTNPSTSSAWLQSELDSFEGLINNFTVSTGHRCTEWWLVTDYTPPAGPAIPVLMDTYRRRRI